MPVRDGLKKGPGLTMFRSLASPTTRTFWFLVVLTEFKLDDGPWSSVDFSHLEKEFRGISCTQIRELIQRLYLLWLQSAVHVYY